MKTEANESASRCCYLQCINKYVCFHTSTWNNEDSRAIKHRSVFNCPWYLPEHQEAHFSLLQILFGSQQEVQGYKSAASFWLCCEVEAHS